MVFLFSKTARNKFITVSNVFVNMILICEAISELVAPRQARSWRGKSVDNAKKRVLHAVNGFYLVKRQATNLKLCKILLLVGS